MTRNEFEKEINLFLNKHGWNLINVPPKTNLIQVIFDKEDFRIRAQTMFTNGVKTKYIIWMVDEDDGINMLFTKQYLNSFKENFFRHEFE